MQQCYDEGDEELHREIDAAWLIGDGKRSPNSSSSSVSSSSKQTLVINGGEKDQMLTSSHFRLFLSLPLTPAGDTTRQGHLIICLLLVVVAVAPTALSCFPEKSTTTSQIGFPNLLVIDPICSPHHCNYTLPNHHILYSHKKWCI